MGMTGEHDGPEGGCSVRSLYCDREQVTKENRLSDRSSPFTEGHDCAYPPMAYNNNKWN